MFCTLNFLLKSVCSLWFQNPYITLRIAKRTTNTPYKHAVNIYNMYTTSDMHIDTEIHQTINQHVIRHANHQLNPWFINLRSSRSSDNYSKRRPADYWTQWNTSVIFFSFIHLFFTCNTHKDSCIEEQTTDVKQIGMGKE